MTRRALGYLWMSIDHFRQTAVIMGLLTAFGIWAITALPADRGAPYVPILFVQFFGASSGLRLESSLGQFDRLLVDGASRRELGLYHYALSIAPGWSAWLIVSGWQLWRLGSSPGLSIAPLGAMLLVSTVAWAVTLPVSRLAGGAVWIALMLAVGSSAQGVDWIRVVLEQASPPGVSDVLWSVVALTAVPFLFLLPATAPIAGSWPVIGCVMTVATGALLAGCYWIQRRDFRGPL